MISQKGGGGGFRKDGMFAAPYHTKTYNEQSESVASAAWFPDHLSLKY